MFASNPKLCVIGLGYVGLPLAVEFGKKITTLGFDINQARVDALRSGVDHTLELTAEELQATTKETDTVPACIQSPPALLPTMYSAQTGIRALGAPNHVLFDVKHLLPKNAVDARL